MNPGEVGRYGIEAQRYKGCMRQLSRESHNNQTTCLPTCPLLLRQYGEKNTSSIFEAVRSRAMLRPGVDLAKPIDGGESVPCFFDHR